MQISAVSNFGFRGKRDNIDAVIQQDNTRLRMAAVEAAKRTANPERHKKINNTIWYSIPVVAGIAAGILHKGPTALFTKNITGTAAKLAKGAAATASWGLALGAADAIVGSKNLINKNCESAQNFEKKHPFLAFAGLLGAGLLVLSYLPKGLAKIYSKINPKIIGKLAEKTGKLADKINGSKIVKSMNKMFNKAGKNVPSVAKEAGKTVLNYAPEALLVGTVLNSLNYVLKVGNQTNTNYNYLKDAQLNLAKARMREMQIENEFLKNFPENEENLKLLKKPFSELPEEIQEKLQQKIKEIDTETEE